jgi:hypothetical protein
MRWNQSINENMAEAPPIEVKEQWSAMTPTNYIRSKMPQSLYPERTEEERLALIETLKPKADKENYHKPHPALPVYTPPPVVPDQADYYDTERSVNYD